LRGLVLGEVREQAKGREPVKAALRYILGLGTREHSADEGSGVSVTHARYARERLANDQVFFGLQSFWRCDYARASLADITVSAGLPVDVLTEVVEDCASPADLPVSEGDHGVELVVLASSSVSQRSKIQIKLLTGTIEPSSTAALSLSPGYQAQIFKAPHASAESWAVDVQAGSEGR